MSCLHCYNSSPYVALYPERLDFAYIIKLFQLLKSFLENEENEILIIFHGGEPLLYGCGFVERICNTAEEVLKPFLDRVEFHIQSNLTVNVTSELVSLLKKYFNNMIGTSYDPYVRLLEGSFERFKVLWEKNVKFLISEGVYVAVSVVLTRYFYEDFDLWIRTVNYLRSLGISSIHIERFTPTGRGKARSGELYLNDKEFFTLMNKILNFYLVFLEKGDVFYINPLEDMIRLSVKGTGVSCWSGTCIFDTLTLEPDGKLYSCPELRAKGVAPIGHVKDFENLYNVIFEPGRVLRTRDICISSGDRTFGCPYYELCHRGCPSAPHDCSTARDECIKFFGNLVEAGKLYSNVLGIRKSFR